MTIVGDCPKEVLLMAPYGQQGLLDRPNMGVMRWRNGALSGNDLSNEPGLRSSRTYQPGEMPLPTKPRPGLRSMHQEMSSEAASSSSQQSSCATKTDQSTRSSNERISVRSEHIPKRNWSGREKSRLEPKKTETCARDCLRIATRNREKR